MIPRTGPHLIPCKLSRRKLPPRRRRNHRCITVDIAGIDKCKATGYTHPQMKIRNFIHKGLKKLYADDTAKGVPPDAAEKLRKMLAFLDDMEDADEMRPLPTWKAHLLTGDRKGAWSLSVTANRRLTFRIDPSEREICDVNLEDYH